jgi:hypothetical protein
MGKIDNIKRLRKIKDAKKKRKQDELIASGMGPASAAMKESEHSNAHSR